MQSPSKTVAAAASCLVCKLIDFLRRMVRRLHVINQHRISEGGAYLGEKEREAFGMKLAQLELRMVQIMKNGFDAEVVAPSVKDMMMETMAMLGISLDFFTKQGVGEITRAVDGLRPKMFRLPAKFIKDTFSAYGPFTMSKELATSDVTVFFPNMRREVPFQGLSRPAKMPLDAYNVKVKEDGVNVGASEIVIVQVAKSENERTEKLKHTEPWSAVGQADVSATAVPARPGVAAPGDSKAASKAPTVSGDAPTAAGVFDTKPRPAFGSVASGLGSSAPMRASQDETRMPPPAFVPVKALQRKAAAKASEAAVAVATMPETCPLGVSGCAGSSANFPVQTKGPSADDAKMPPPSFLPVKALRRRAAAKASGAAAAAASVPEICPSGASRRVESNPSFLVAPAAFLRNPLSVEDTVMPPRFY